MQDESLDTVDMSLSHMEWTPTYHSGRTATLGAGRVWNMLGLAPELVTNLIPLGFSLSMIYRGVFLEGMAHKKAHHVAWAEANATILFFSLFLIWMVLQSISTDFLLTARTVLASSFVNLDVCGANCGIWDFVLILAVDTKRQKKSWKCYCWYDAM